LKERVPEPTANVCCVSGTVARSGGGGAGSGVAGHWSAWLNRDDPGGAADREALAELSGSVPCARPVAIECRVRGSELDWRATGQRYACSLDAPDAGGICKNADDPGGCLDYEVRFLCP
jgi:hypothetical protein